MIYILGGSGFVGSAYARLFEALKLPHRVITRQNYTEWVGTSCDLLINAAGNSKKFLADRDPLAEFEASVTSVHRSLIDFNATQYVYLSSCDVYGDCSGPGTSEASELHFAQQSVYGFHKYLAEQCVQKLAPKWLIFRMGGFVGPGLKKNPIFDMLTGSPLWLDPRSRLQYMHTDMAAQIVWQLCQKGASAEIFNLCGSGTIELSEVYEQTGKRSAVQPNSPQVTYEVNVDKLKSIVTVPDSRQAVLSFVASYQ